jgi:TPR repeat protein/CHAT domain-containing protein
MSGIRIGMLLGVFLLILPTKTMAEEPGAACDRLAAIPTDPAVQSAGVEIGAINFNQAIPVCRDAIAKDPDKPRFKFQLSRALVAGEQYFEAQNAATSALADGYKIANVILGYLEGSGKLAPKDEAKATHHYLKAAEAGLPLAAYAYAVRVSRGLGTDKDIDVALKWINFSADEGYGPANADLGRAYLKGKLVKQDYTKAKTLLERGAEKGIPDALNNLGAIYNEGLGVLQDRKRAAEYFRLAIDGGLAIAHVNFGRLLEFGNGVPKNPAAAEKHYRKALKKGYLPADIDLAIVLRDTPELNGDPKEIANLLLSAAKRGNPLGYMEFGLLLISGNGIKKDTKRGIELLKKAANSGRANDSFYELGKVYENGLGVPINLSDAFNWYSRAANIGDKFSKYKIAKMLIEGKGTLQNIKKGVADLTKLATGGYRAAQGALGDIYSNEKYMPTEYAQAAHWYRQASNQQGPFATSRLGNLYLNGLGVEKNIEVGITLMVRAAKSGWSSLQEAVGSALLKIGKIDQGLPWLRKAASQDPKNSRITLAQNLMELKRSPEEVEEGLILLRKTAESGSVYAQYLLGVAFQNGTTGSKDLDKAFEWINRAAEANYSYAQSLLGSYFWDGLGTSQNYETAVLWFRRAAKLKNAHGILMLGFAYKNGKGVPKNLEKATMFYKESARLKNPIAYAYLALLNTTGELQDTALTSTETFIDNAIKLSKKSSIIERAQVFRLVGLTLNIRAQFIKAETYLRKAIKLSKEASTEQSENYVRALRGLASVLQQSGRYNEAEKLFEKSLSITDQIEGDHRVLIGGIQSDFALLKESKGEFSSAVDLFAKIKSSLRFAPGEYTARMDVFINSAIARILTKQRKFDEAEEHFIEAFDGLSANAIQTGPSVLRLKADYAQLLVRTGRIKEAEENFRAVFKGVKAFKLEGHPLAIAAMPDFVDSLMTLNRMEEAQAVVEAAIGVLVFRISRQSRQSFGEPLREKNVFSSAFPKLLESLIDERSGNRRDRERNVGLSFRLYQLIQSSRADRAIAKMGARFASGDDELANLVRKRQDSVDKWRSIDQMTIASLGGNRQAGKVDIKNLGPESEKLKEVIETIDLQLLAKYPKYFELAAPKPLKISAVQKLLNDDEALVSYLFGDRKSFVWVVRRNDWFATTLDIEKSDLDAVVRDIRQGVNSSGITQLSQVPEFPRARAYELYNKIFAPIERMLKGVRHVMAVPDGALKSLPLGVLVTKNPEGSFTDFSGYRQVPWLAKKYALSILPSVNSLRALRAFAKDGSAEKPFIGFGDPTLNGRPSDSRGVKVASLFSRGPIADARKLQSLGSLPDTANELRAIAKSLGADKSSIYLGNQATETLVKSTDLSKARVLAFATHGLIAGEFKGISEPGLVLTPPENGNEYDDGYLTASEVARLKLNADWVILSACNTAASDGDTGAEGLSGLARAFFYAGSRSLLVSHWPVLSEAAKALTTRLFEEAKVNTVGRAEALKRSMIALMNSPDAPYLAHPMFWAPFSVVGEGK